MPDQTLIELIALIAQNHVDTNRKISKLQRSMKYKIDQLTKRIDDIEATNRELSESIDNIERQLKYA